MYCLSLLPMTLRASNDSEFGDPFTPNPFVFSRYLSRRWNEQHCLSLTCLNTVSLVLVYMLFIRACTCMCIALILPRKGLEGSLCLHADANPSSLRAPVLLYSFLTRLLRTGGWSSSCMCAWLCVFLCMYIYIYIYI